MKKATAIAPSNIAFVKYWGRKNELLRLPENGSISMNLSGLTTRTTVEFSSKYSQDVVEIDGSVDPNEQDRAIRHLDRIRELAGIFLHARVVTMNNFPSGTGLSSSASGFAALTMAAVEASGLHLSEKQLSIVARQGSGSACRSIPSGFIEWLDGETSDASYAVSLFAPNYWSLADVVVVVNEGKKDVSTSEGQKLVSSSPFFPERLKHIKNKIRDAKSFLQEKDFQSLGELIEAEALELHAIMLTSQPSLIYWTPGTLRIMKEVKQWRKDGIQVYFTINTGQDVHLICMKKDVPTLKERLEKISEIKQIIINHPCEGAHIVSDHLF